MAEFHQENFKPLDRIMSDKTGITMRSYGQSHESHTPDAPAYGTICRTGKEWTVTMQTKQTDTGVTISGTRSGYGAFPFNEYYGLPVIDFTGESFDRCFEGIKTLESIRVRDDISLLPAFIKSYQDSGFKVHVNGYEGI